jgi:hypothetical protein
LSLRAYCMSRVPVVLFSLQLATQWRCDTTCMKHFSVSPTVQPYLFCETSCSNRCRKKNSLLPLATVAAACVSVAPCRQFCNLCRNAISVPVVEKIVRASQPIPSYSHGPYFFPFIAECVLLQMSYLKGFIDEPVVCFINASLNICFLYIFSSMEPQVIKR